MKLIESNRQGAIMRHRAAAVMWICVAGCGTATGRSGADGSSMLGAECVKLAACCGGDTTCIDFLSSTNEATCKAAQSIYCDRDLSVGGVTDLAAGAGDGGLDLAVGGSDLPPPRDFAARSDIAQMIGCMDLIACSNACTTQACLTNCHNMATAQANALNKTLDDCIIQNCVTAPDGGTAPCAGTDQTACNTCVMNTQTGRSPTGMTNGTCSPPSDPVCGLCVDQLIACANDLTM
jgi:hypothetical protein